jgi:hypothetical protein
VTAKSEARDASGSASLGGETRHRNAGLEDPRRISDREATVLGIIETARAKRARFRDEAITMSHGAGGKATQSLIEGLFAPAFTSPTLDDLGDAGVLQVAPRLELAMTTDTFVVHPLRFPGGSIGELAVNGTVNDLAVSGAEPHALSVALVLEEGLSAEALRADEHDHQRLPLRLLGRSPRQAYAIGLVHGTGGSAGVGILLLAGIPHKLEAAAALAVFAAAAALSMATLSSGFGYALTRGPLLRRTLSLAPGMGLATLAFGVWYALGALSAVPYPL